MRAEGSNRSRHFVIMLLGTGIVSYALAYPFLGRMGWRAIVLWPLSGLPWALAYLHETKTSGKELDLSEFYMMLLLAGPFGTMCGLIIVGLAVGAVLIVYSKLL